MQFCGIDSEGSKRMNAKGESEKDMFDTDVVINTISCDSTSGLAEAGEQPHQGL